MLDPAVSPISFYEALAQKNLIYGSVRPEEGVDKPKLPYIRLRENLDPKLKEQFVIDHSENAISDEANWMFRLLKK